MSESRNGRGTHLLPRLCVVTAGGQVPAVIINIGDKQAKRMARKITAARVKEIKETSRCVEDNVR